MTTTNIKERARELVNPLVMDMSWINKPDYQKTLEKLADQIIDTTLTTYQNELVERLEKKRKPVEKYDFGTFKDQESVQNHNYNGGLDTAISIINSPIK